MFQIIPTIGTVLALTAFFFAVYYRSVQRFARIGVDSVRSIGELPMKSRLDATKVLVNVFDLDVNSLTPDQQFQLALRTFEKREKESKRNFLLLLAGGGVMLLVAAGYWTSRMNGAVLVRTALLADRANADGELNKRGYYMASDTRLVDNLAKAATVDRNIIDPFERVEKFTSVLSKQPTVQELRTRAQTERAPFEVTGDILIVSVPKRGDQPPRYTAYVRRQSPLDGRAISIRTKGRGEYLRLFAKGAVDSDSPADLQLNFEQFAEVFGDKPRELRKVLVTPSAEPNAFDPTCPRYQGFSITACDLPQTLSLDALPSRVK